MTLSSQDILTALQPELDQLLIAVNVEPDEREAFATAAIALFRKCQTLEDEHDLDWPPDGTLAVVQFVCASHGMIDHAAAVAAIRDFNAQARAESAKLN